MNYRACLLLYTLLLSCSDACGLKVGVSPGPAFGRITFGNNLLKRDSLRDRTRASPMLSPQNQRNRALQRAFQGTTAVSVLASAGALPAAIASKKTPDAKFLSLNRWRKPSEVLSRNWRHNRLSANELYENRDFTFLRWSTKRQFLAQATEPQAFVNASSHSVS